MSKITTIFDITSARSINREALNQKETDEIEYSYHHNCSYRIPWNERYSKSTTERAFKL